MAKQNYSAAPASVKVRQCRQRTKAFVSELIGRKVGYLEALKVKRDLAALGVLPITGKTRTKPNEPLRPLSLAAKARDAGLAPQRVYDRILGHGWSEERALSTPVGMGSTCRDAGLAGKARAVGLPPDMVRRRVRNGMTEEQALTTPPVEYQRRQQA